MTQDDFDHSVNSLLSGQNLVVVLRGDDLPTVLEYLKELILRGEQSYDYEDKDISLFFKRSDGRVIE